MNQVKHVERINAAEVERNIADSASWHADYADSAYIYVGGLDPRLTEGDVVTIFSQVGGGAPRVPSARGRGAELPGGGSMGR
jgi:RNA-binding motif X-linked protein 2